MTYYQFKRQDILQKVKEKYSKGKAAEYYLEAYKKRSNKKSQKNDTKTCHKKKKTRFKNTKEKDFSD